MKPLEVEILHKTQLLSVDHEYEIECLASGARPSANITWFLGDKPVERIALKVSTSRCSLDLASECADYHLYHMMKGVYVHIL